MNHIGLDFDNTLIDYDLLFYKLAVELKLIPIVTQKSKLGVRDYLIKAGREKSFTKLQGEVYGKKIEFAEASKGVIEALQELKEKGFKFSIVSHKTKFPIIGEKINLHLCALDWLKNNKFLDKNGLNIQREDIYFEPTKEKKIKRINYLNCDYYIDDLEEILLELNERICKIHYNKNANIDKSNNDLYLLNDWNKLNSSGILNELL